MKTGRFIIGILVVVLGSELVLQAADPPSIERTRAAILMHQQTAVSNSVVPTKVVDVGNIAVMSGNRYTYIREAPYNLQNKLLTFTPNSTGGYDLKVTDSSSTITEGPIKGFASGSREIPFEAGFHFPFYGKTYSSVFVNTNGGLTFGEGSNLYPDLIPYLSGPPRISGVMQGFGYYINPTAS